MPKADKKLRHKKKRAAKRTELRRRQSGGPLKQLVDARCDVDCWSSGDFCDRGQMQIFVFKQAGRLSGVACFLIDQGVVGLKDAWTRMNVDRMELLEMLESSMQNGIPMRLVALDDVRDVIAGAVRWTQQWGMRLPKDWAKTVTLIGGIGDWKSADVSQFTNEFAGHPEDLRQRLVGESLDNFLSRKDVRIIFNDTAPYMDQGTGDYIHAPGFDALESDEWEEGDEEEMDSDELEADGDFLKARNALMKQTSLTAIALSAETADWLTSRNEISSPQLFEAWSTLLVARLFAKLAAPDAPSAEVDARTDDLVNDFAEHLDQSERLEFDRAVAQAHKRVADDPLIVQKILAKQDLEAEA